MARRFFGRRRSPVLKRRPHWAAATETLELNLGGVGPNVTIAEIFGPADYASNQSLSPTGVTVRRVVGSVTLAGEGQAGLVLSGGYLHFRAGIAVCNEDELDHPALAARLDLFAVGPLTRERWIALSPDRAFAGNDFVYNVSWEIDTRVRVKCQETSLALVMIANVIEGWEVNVATLGYSVRTLCAGDTT